MNPYVAKRLADIAAEHEQATAPRPIHPSRLTLAEDEERRAREIANGETLRIAQHIYIFRAGKHVKVGVAADCMKRWRGVATGNPLLEREFFYTPEKYEDALGIERRTHEILARFRVKNAYCREWFGCTIEEATQALEQALTEGGL